MLKKQHRKLDTLPEGSIIFNPSPCIVPLPKVPLVVKVARKRLLVLMSMGWLLVVPRNCPCKIPFPVSSHDVWLKAEYYTPATSANVAKSLKFVFIRKSVGIYRVDCTSIWLLKIV